MREIKIWLKDWIWVLLNRGKCPRCDGTLTKNALGFHNCEVCFGKYAAKMLGEDYNNWLS